MADKLEYRTLVATKRNIMDRLHVLRTLRLGGTYTPAQRAEVDTLERELVRLEFQIQYIHFTHIVIA